RALPEPRSGIRDSHRASRTARSITASAITTTAALRSLAAPSMTTTDIMTAAGAGYGRIMDRSGPTSAPPTVTATSSGCRLDDRRRHFHFSMPVTAITLMCDLRCGPQSNIVEAGWECGGRGQEADDADQRPC